jgi:hypothetical protein
LWCQIALFLNLNPMFQTVTSGLWLSVKCKCTWSQNNVFGSETHSHKWERIVEMKFKFLQNISHYCNNIFAFHMPMFTIFVLSFNKLNTTIHSNIRFMVITYNQNLHFIIHYKELHKQDYNSFHHNLTLKKIHTKVEHRIHYKSLCFFILLKTWIQITA